MIPLLSSGSGTCLQAHAYVLREHLLTCRIANMRCGQWPHAAGRAVNARPELEAHAMLLRDYHLPTRVLLDLGLPFDEQDVSDFSTEARAACTSLQAMSTRCCHACETMTTPNSPDNHTFINPCIASRWPPCCPPAHAGVGSGRAAGGTVGAADRRRDAHAAHLKAGAGTAPLDARAASVSVSMATDSTSVGAHQRRCSHRHRGRALQRKRARGRQPRQANDQRQSQQADNYSASHPPELDLQQRVCGMACS